MELCIQNYYQKEENKAHIKKRDVGILYYIYIYRYKNFQL